MTTRAFQPGMKFSAGDGVVLLAAVAGVCWWWNDAPWLSRVILFVTLNFYLFCNVFRVPQNGELVWAIVFVALAGYRLQTGGIEWWVIYTVASLLTAAVIAIAMRQPSYHGLGWSRVNPKLEEWWNENCEAVPAQFRR